MLPLKYEMIEIVATTRVPNKTATRNFRSYIVFIIGHLTVELSGGADWWLMFDLLRSVLKNERNF